MDSTKNTARLAGLLYLFLTITGAYSILYVPSKIIVRGDAAATGKNIISNEFLFRTGMISDIISNTIFIFLALVLYRLLKQVNEHQAKVLVILVLVQIPIVFVMEAFNITSLMIFKGDILKSFDLIQRQDLGMSLLKFNRNMTLTLEVFWGLWLIPFGQLIYKSSFIPRILGIMLMLGGIAYLIESFTGIVLPDNVSTVSKFTFVFYSLAEISTMLWLLIKGVKSNYK